VEEATEEELLMTLEEIIYVIFLVGLVPFFLCAIYEK